MNFIKSKKIASDNRTNRKGIFKILNIKENKLSFGKAIFFLMLCAILLARFQTFVTNGSLFFEDVSLSAELSPILLWLNALPLFILLCFFYFLTGSAGFSFSFISILFTVMLTVNFFKVEFRAENFIPTDIATFGEAAGVGSMLKFRFSKRIILSVMICVIANIAVWMLIRCKKVSFKKRIISLLVSAACAVTAYGGIYTNTDLYRTIPSFADIWTDISVMQSKGFLYMFMTRFSLFTYDAPDGYSKDTVSEIYNSTPSSSLSLPEGYVAPDVIAIMGESYFDIKRTNLEFADGVNPTKNLENLRSDGVYGDLIVRGLGGGTVISEFEFLTANALPFITDAIVSPYNTYISKDAYSIPTFLKENYNYHNLAMHLGNEWFYNRRSTYPRIGFDNSLFYEDIADTNPEKAFNGYTKDSVLSDMIINSHRDFKTQNPNTPYFNFNITIENHLPYDENDPGEAVIKKTDTMADNVYSMVNRYAQILKSTDDVLGNVAEYLNTIDTPAVLVFYGDHLPNLNQQTNDILPQIGIDTDKTGYENDKSTHNTPYLIWGNTAYRNQLEKFGLEVECGKSQTISSNYLGIKMLEYMNIPLNSHYSFIAGAKSKLPVITPYYCVDENDKQVNISSLNEEQSAIYDNYKNIQYYALIKYDKKMHEYN